MTSHALAAALENAGLHPDEIPAKRRLYAVVSAACRNVLRIAPERVWWVPGRLEVFGTHTDYAGGRAVVTAVPRGFVFVASRRRDETVRVLDADRLEQVALDPRAAASRHGGWRRFVEVVVERLARNFPDAALGADIAFASDLPRASGMSSSSALVVGVASALVSLAGLRNRPAWRLAIPDSPQEATYYSCLENGLPFGTLAGDAGVGTHGGSEDHAAMLCTTPGALSGFRFLPLRHLGDQQIPDPWQFVICSSGVAAEKTGAAREAYNRLAAGARGLLDLWNETERPAASLGNVLDSPSGRSRLSSLVRRLPGPGLPQAALERRLEHFVGENARVTASLEAFRAEDRTGIGQLAAASQQDAETLLENQIEATRALVRVATAEGAFAARSFGAGFGGSVWALADRAAAPTFAGRWLAQYRSTCPQAEFAEVFLVNPTPPVTDLTELC